MSGLPWTTEEDAELRRLHATVPTLSFTEIAEQMDRNRCACIGRAHRLKLPDRSEFYRVATPAKPSTAGVKRRRGPVSTTRIADARARTAKPGLVPTRQVLAEAPDGCQWPCGDYPFVSCGAGVEKGQVYCGEHCRLAYRPRRAA